jgi:hypothetical protein
MLRQPGAGCQPWAGTLRPTRMKPKQEKSFRLRAETFLEHPGGTLYVKFALHAIFQESASLNSLRPLFFFYCALA